MDDDWDDHSATTTGNGAVNGVASDGGRRFGGGRGFKSEVSSKSDWGPSNTNSFSNNTDGDNDGWGDSNSNNNNFDSDRPRRGGGGRGRGGGGRGGRGGFRRNDNDDNENGDGDDYRRNGDFEGRGRGRGGRGRGGRGGRGGGGDRGGGDDDGGGFGGDSGGFGDGEDGEEKKKPVEHYIPVERDEEELFQLGIQSGINFMKLSETAVDVSGENVPAPITSFASSGLRPFLLDNVTKSGYNQPTPIQKHSIPIVLKGRDLMGCAQTGSGKTAAFLLPIIHYLMENNCQAITDENGAQPQAVIVSPTRELTTQISVQAKKFAKNSIVKVVEIYGGTSTNHQRSNVRGGCHILVATPGRLNDFVKRECVSFASLKFFILDEADRMLDMGFLPDIEKMLGDPSMPATGERQTLMFSATFPEEIQHLAAKFLHDYIFIAVGIVGSASTDVEQNFIQIEKFNKRAKLLEVLREGGNEKTLVFVETKRNADFLAAFLSESDIKTTSIHGDRLQREREQALWEFQKGICNILVATGVAARGLDIKDVQHVINFDLPNNIDEYVHRIGRTGRVGNRGKATSFFDATHDSNQAQSFAKIMKQAGQNVPQWLATGDFSCGSSDNFGGRDIRGGDFGKAQNFNAEPADEVEEEW